MKKRWDFFIAYSSLDRPSAEKLYEGLIIEARVFLDSRCLMPGENWDTALQNAQKDSMVTLVLISQQTDSAYYQREEIAAAVDMSRPYPKEHHVVPIYLDQKSNIRKDIPYGLRLKHGIFVDESGDIDSIVKILLNLKRKLLNQSLSGDFRNEQSEAYEEIISDKAPEWLQDSVVGFIGQTEKGPTTPMLVTSWSEFQEIFGQEIDPSISFLPYCVRGFFHNGGKIAYVARILSTGTTYANCGIFDLEDKPCIEIKAKSPGAWGNRILSKIEKGIRCGIRIRVSYYREDSELFDTDRNGQVFSKYPIPEEHEDFDNLSVDPDGPNFFVDVINHNSGLITITNISDMYPLKPRFICTWLKDGHNGEICDAEKFIGHKDPNLSKSAGLSALEEIEEISILCVPDHVNPSISKSDREKITGYTICQCEKLNNRIAILSLCQNNTNLSEISIPYDTSFAAIYYPWINVIKRNSQNSVLIPPVGHIAGIFSRNDSEIGVHRAPVDQILQDVYTDSQNSGPLEFEFKSEDIDLLWRLGINAIARDGLDRNIRIVRAITLAIDYQLKPIRIKRFQIFFNRAVERIKTWAIFEKNDKDTWSKVQNEITELMNEIFKQGVFVGDTPEEAFFVKCDETTMTEDDILNKRIVAQIGYALVSQPEDNVNIKKEGTFKSRIFA